MAGCADCLELVAEDPDPEEERWKTIGMAERTVIIVIHTWPQPGEPGRIISSPKSKPG